MKQLAVLRNRKWADEEVKEDLDYIYDALAKSVTIISSLDMYCAELKNRRMEWSPVHKSETFWRENATKLCPASGSVENSTILRELIGLFNETVDKSAKERLDLDDKT